MSTTPHDPFNTAIRTAALDRASRNAAMFTIGSGRHAVALTPAARFHYQKMKPAAAYQQSAAAPSIGCDQPRCNR
jgi:hypothetical protein